MKTGRFAMIALALLLFSDRAFSATASDTLAENRAKWKAHHPDRFAFEYMTSCIFCVAPKWRVEVDGDSVIAVTNTNSHDPAHHEDNLQYYSMDSIFSRIGTELQTYPGHRMHYNALLGYPDTATFIDSPRVGDGGYSLYLTGFQDAAVAIRIPPSSSAGASRPGPSRDLSGRAVLRSHAGPKFVLPR